MTNRYRYFFSLLVLLFSYNAKAQQFDVDTIQYQGTTKNMVNLVILGDGYTQSELDKFEKDAKVFKEYFFSQHPFSRYKDMYNVFLIKVVSLESGAKHANNALDCAKGVVHDSVALVGNRLSTNTPMPIANPNNFFGSSFDNSGLHRLVVAHNQLAITQVLKDNFPNYNQALIMVNSPYYGGSGGFYPTATTNVASNAIAIHELGHSFANLADEYWPGVQFLGENANRSQHANPNLVPWKRWIGTQGVGVYTYGGKSPQAVWYRPHEYCKMQYLVAPFCVVCSEAIIEKIYTIVNPITNSFPNSDNPLSADSLKLFRVKLASPDPNTLKIEWTLNGKRIASQIDSVRVDPGMLTVGQNILTMKLADTTAYVRNTPKAYQTSWNINHLKDVELKKPQVRWGDTLQTCFNSHTVLTVMRPQAGLSYKWYDKKKARRPIATGINFISPKLDKDVTYYLEATFGKKKAERIATVVNVLEEVPMPEIAIQLGDTISLAIVNPDPSMNYKWYQNETDLKPISSYRRQTGNQPANFRLNREGTILKVPASEKDVFWYVEASNKTTTCNSKMKKNTN